VSMVDVEAVPVDSASPPPCIPGERGEEVVVPDFDFDSVRSNPAVGTVHSHSD
jgi:hypothetical protein